MQITTTEKTTTEPATEELPVPALKPSSSSLAPTEGHTVVIVTGHVVSVFVIVVLFVAVIQVILPCLHYTQMFTLHITHERLVVL